MEETSEISIEFTLSLEECGQAAQKVAAQNNCLWVITGWLGFPLIAFLLISIFQHKIDAGNFTGWMLGLVFGFVVMMYPFSFSAAAKREAIKSKSTSISQAYTFGSAGVTIKTKLSELKLDWKSFQKVFESKEFYFFVLIDNPRSFYFIPKRAFQTREEENGLRNLMAEHISNIPIIDKGLKGWKLSVLVSFLSLVVNYFAFSLVK